MEKRELPDGWEWKRLGDVIQIGRDLVNNDRELNQFSSFIGLENIESNEGIITGSIPTGNNGIKSSKFRFTSNDILYGKLRPYLNKVALPDFDGICSTDILVLKPITEMINRQYLAYSMRSEKFVRYATTRSSGANLPRINPHEILEFVIPLPSLPVQRQIVEILDQADALRRLRAQADSETQKLLQSVFYEMFGDPVRNEMGWDVKNLGDIAIVKDVDHKMPKSIEDGVLFLSPKDFVGDDEIDFIHAKRISEIDFKKLSKKIKPEFEDIIYSRIGTIGKVRLVPNDIKFQISYSLCIIRVISDQIDVKFLKYVLKNPLFERHAIYQEKSIAVPDLGLSEILRFKIIIPPLTIQQQFVQIAEKVERIRKTQGELYGAIEHLFDILMTKAFTGELN